MRRRAADEQSAVPSSLLLAVRFGDDREKLALTVLGRTVQCRGGPGRIAEHRLVDVRLESPGPTGELIPLRCFSAGKPGFRAETAFEPRFGLTPRVPVAIRTMSPPRDG
jgi:hypothetical protein